MDLMQILSWISLASNIYSETKSNDDVSTKVKNIVANGLPIVTAAAKALFPSLPASSLPAAGASMLDKATTEKLQAYLNSKGASLGVDGVYGQKTKSAVTAYQQANGLTVDGWAGHDTLTKMGLI